MSRTRERCPRCTSKLVVSRFDTAFRLDDSSERLCFGIPGSLCQGCVQLFVDPDLLDLLDLDRAVCTFAIESAMDELARKLDMDPVELRRKNMLRPSKIGIRSSFVSS